LLRTIAIAAAFLALFIWGVFSSPFAEHAEIAPSAEREPAFRDNFYDVAMRDNFAWIVGYHGTVLRSHDHGLTWELQQSGTIEALFRVNFIDQEEGWVAGSYGTILHTRDGGKSWERQKAPVEEHLFGLNFINHRHGWAVGSRGTVLATEDGGVTWVDRSIGDDVILNDVCFIDPEQGWAVGEFGRIYISKDSGRTWLKQKSPIEVPLVSGESRNLFRLLLPNSHSGWAFGLDGVILSTNNGEMWGVSSPSDAAVSNAKGYHLFSASAVHGTTWAVGERGTVLVSSIDSHEWSPAGLKAPPLTLNGIAFGNDDAGLIVGNRGVILHTADAGKEWKQIRIASNRSANGAYPNQ
jgi:photosystem II stability/assembly factor-like uncharacterized protein